MQYEFEIKDVPMMPVLYINGTCRLEDIGPTLGRLLPKVFGTLVDLGVRPAGPPFCRYTARHEGECDLQAGILVDGLVSGIGEIQGGQIGGCSAAHTVHMGPYTELKDAYAALDAWIREQGKTPGDSPFELYMTDPGKVPDPAQWKTEIYWPVS